MNKIVMLDAKTLGNVSNLNQISSFGKFKSFETTDAASTIEHIGDAQIVITNKVVIDRKVMQSCPSLKLICISATGMNNVDLVAAKEFGIVVKNAVGYSSHSVAQHTFAVILQLIHQISYYDHYVKSGEYSKNDIFTHNGPSFFELHGKSFGIIGLGNIGKNVAKIASGFGANIYYYSTSGANNNADYDQLSLEELLSHCDIISIHAPLNERTKNLISAPQLSMMQPHAILVNVGRGGIVDETALAQAIDQKRIGGACLDVFVTEPISPENPLLKVKYPEKLILSPHNAWTSIESREKLIDIVTGNIESFLNLER
jgi:glycerate dehydrogenase